MDIKEATVEQLCKELGTRVSSLLVVGKMNSNSSIHQELLANTVGTPLDVSDCVASLLCRANDMSRDVIENNVEPTDSVAEISMVATTMLHGVVNTELVLEAMSTFRAMSKNLTMDSKLRSATKQAMFAKLVTDYREFMDSQQEDDNLGEEEEHEDT